MSYDTWIQKLQKLYSQLEISHGPKNRSLVSDIANQKLELLKSPGLAFIRPEYRAAVIQILPSPDILSGDNLIELFTSLNIHEDLLEAIKKSSSLNKDDLAILLYLLVKQDLLPAEIRRALYVKLANSYTKFFDWKQTSDPGWPRIFFGRS